MKILNNFLKLTNKVKELRLKDMQIKYFRLPEYLLTVNSSGFILVDDNRASDDRIVYKPKEKKC